MTSKRLHPALIGVISLLLIGLLAGTYGINKMLGTQANKLTGLKAKNQALEQERLSFKKARKDIKTYSGLYKIAQSVVPEDKDQAEAVREIVNIAAANNVNLAAINFPASTLGGNGMAQAGGTSGTTKPSASAGNSKTNSLSQLTPVKSIKGVYELPITVEGDPKNPVRYDEFISFLSALEHNRRTAQVSTVSIHPDTKDSNYLSFTLNLNEYIKP